MMATRAIMDWEFKALDQQVIIVGVSFEWEAYLSGVEAGLSFKSDFHFALVGYLLKGLRNDAPLHVQVRDTVQQWRLESLFAAGHDDTTAEPSSQRGCSPSATAPLRSPPRLPPLLARSASLLRRGQRTFTGYRVH